MEVLCANVYFEISVYGTICAELAFTALIR